MAVTFDTLKYANRLKAAGITADVAEAQAEALNEIFEVNLKELATKEDLRHLEERLTERFDAKLAQLDAKLNQLDAKFETKLAQLDDKFDAKLTQLEQRMIIKLGTLMVIAVGAMAALVKVL